MSCRLLGFFLNVNKGLVHLLLVFVMVFGKKRLRENQNQNVLESNTTWIDISGNLRKSFALGYALDNFKKNTVSSPISALLAIGKVALAATDKNLEELLDAIGLKNRREIGPHFRPIIAALRFLPGVTLDIASRLYVDIKTHLQSKFDEEAKEIFHASVAKVNFETPVTTADTINNWVAEQTMNMIKEIVKSDDVSPDTSLILINAIYFLGKWKDPFVSVQASTFHTPTDVRRVSMMSITREFNYTDCKFLNAKLVMIPYVGGKTSFLIVVPNAINGLKVLLAQLKLAPELLNKAIDEMKPKKVDLAMPKFKIESKMDLRNMLEKVGVKRIFNKYESGLSGMVKDKKVFVSKATQKAIIEVNEFGTEAAAVSAVHIELLSLQLTEHVHADHPFLFYVLAHKHQLFVGTVVYPSG
ncbi:alaserpin-like isoform X2 [Leptidea sinapis]|uniref:alaserpin-like isoform X2 n=1 Tax=Leptidea sinapis TaxID=189913 RepID=UPI0021C3D847|nr:alaserpin-like isoform X2 [Leptidea sinapis]